MPWAPGGAQGIGPQEAEGRLSRPTAIPTAILARGLPRFFLFGLFGPWPLYLAYGLGPLRYFFILLAPIGAGRIAENFGPWLSARSPAM